MDYDLCTHKCRSSEEGCSNQIQRYIHRDESHLKDQLLIALYYIAFSLCSH